MKLRTIKRLLRPLKRNLIKRRNAFLNLITNFILGNYSYAADRYEKAYIKSPLYVPYKSKTKKLNSKHDVKLIAFYFPQYHPFPENDRFWGKGFTEWTNVTKAVPAFDGHYQPRLPDELGFYDLRLKEVMKRQIEIAINYGIYGFCFHHYWFMGKPVMRVPYNHILANPDLDVPFCLHWANEPWTLQWDGFDVSGVLLEQKHTAVDDIEFIKDIEPALRDRRYIRIDDRPLLIIYRPDLFPDMKTTIARWNEYCQKRGIGKLYLATMQTVFGGETDPRDYGFDAAIEYPPHNLLISNTKNALRLFVKNYQGFVSPYTDVVNRSVQREKRPYTLFRGAIPDWDSTPRKKNPGILIGSTPELYGTWLEKQCEFTKQHYAPRERLVFINAWNEWAEGAYLEPDRKHGYAYLEATHAALRKANQKIAVVSHIFYDELAPEILRYLKNIPVEFDLFVSTHKQAENSLLQLFAGAFDVGNVEIRLVENRGRDMAPFVVEFKDVYKNYDLICWVHSKKTSAYGNDLSGWRTYLLDNLLGSPKIISEILNEFSHNKNLGVLFPEYFPPIKDMVSWGRNFTTAQRILEKAGIAINQSTPLTYPAGGMFWFRPEALESLFNLGLSFEDFELKSEQEVDGTLAHAIERIILIIAEHNNYSWKKLAFKDKN